MPRPEFRTGIVVTCVRAQVGSHRNVCDQRAPSAVGRAAAGHRGGTSCGAPPRIFGHRPQSLPRGRTGTLADLGLIRQKDGSYLYVDPSRRFTAVFRDDGSVEFSDRWRRPSRNNQQRGKCCGVIRGLGVPNPLIGAGTSGPLEWLLRMAGEDPAGGAKASLLERTRELRTQLAVAWGKRILKQRPP